MRCWMLSLSAKFQSLTWVERLSDDGLPGMGVHVELVSIPHLG